MISALKTDRGLALPDLINGAYEYIDGSKVDQAEALQALGGAKIIMCTAPSSESFQKLVPGLSVDGTLLIVAVEPAPMTVSPRKRPSRFHILGRIEELTVVPPSSAADGRPPVDKRMAVRACAGERGVPGVREGPRHQVPCRDLPAGQGPGGVRPPLLRTFPCGDCSWTASLMSEGQRLLAQVS